MIKKGNKNGEKSSKRKNLVEPTLLQKRAVDNILSGRYKNKGDALHAAGYAKSSTVAPSRLLQAEGVRQYLEEIDREMQQKNGTTLKQKVMDTYLDGLDATRLVGKDAIEHPDYATRKQFADRFAEFFGWQTSNPVQASQHNTFNFFSVDKEKQDEFNEQFKKFLRSGLHKPQQSRSNR